MNNMDADLVLICSNLSAHALGSIDRAADDLAELGERAKARDIRIGFEALACGRHINDHRDAWEVVRRADHSHFGLILDSFHTLSRKIDPDTIRAIPSTKSSLFSSQTPLRSRWTFSIGHAISATCRVKVIFQLWNA